MDATTTPTLRRRIEVNDQTVKTHRAFNPEAPDKDHRVFAVTQNGTKVAGAARTWDEAITLHRALDDLRLAGRTPQFRYLAVRHVDAPDWHLSLYKPRWFAPVVEGRGFASASAAAKRASELYLDDATPNGRPNGTGGWYYKDGSPIAQGRSDLVRHTRARGWILEIGGRWFVLDATPDPTTD